jgi:dCTP deaminase
MSTIVDCQIEALALSEHPLITPFRYDQVNPASYDVRLDANILVEMPDGTGWFQRKLPYILEPGEFVLGCTQESFCVPNYMEAVFQLKSSRGREGYEHVLSGYIDPGFRGNLTLELVNVNRYKSLPLVKDMLIGQIRFMKTDQPCMISYDSKGHYQGDLTVQPSKTNVFGLSS